jgi:hypothetical protein
VNSRLNFDKKPVRVFSNACCVCTASGVTSSGLALFFENQLNIDMGFGDVKVKKKPHEGAVIS